MEKVFFAVLVLVTLSVSLGSQDVFADEIMIKFQGTVSEVSVDPTNALSGIFGPGDAITGFYSFDSEAVDENAGDSDVGKYLLDNLRIVLEGRTYTDDGIPDASMDFIVVSNDDLADSDFYTVRSSPMVQQSGDPTIPLNSFFFFLEDEDESIFNDDSLPLMPPSLVEIEDQGFALFFDDGSPSTTLVAVSGMIDKIEVIEQVVGGELIPIETTSLMLAGAQTFSWMIPVVLSILGIGLFVVSRKSE